MTACTLRWPWLLLVASSVALSGCRERGAREICGNGADDDGNGVSDCDDTACTSEPACGVATDAGPSDAPFVRVDANLGDAGPSTECGPLDVVFVLDVSTSMEESLDALRAGIGDVWTAASALSPDPRFSLVVFVDDALAVNGCTPFASVDELRAGFDTWRAFCASNESPVSHAYNTDFPENSMDALYTAATTCTFREGATRIVVHVTDDTFFERPAVFSDSVTCQHTYDEVARAYVAFELRLASFHDTADHPEGFSAPYRGGASLVDRTGGASFSFDDVVSGRLDMGESIRTFVQTEFCTPFLI
ncbi:MAG: hypothetical protein U0353_14800 [Sandaracinus sp.]